MVEGGSSGVGIEVDEEAEQFNVGSLHAGEVPGEVPGIVLEGPGRGYGERRYRPFFPMALLLVYACGAGALLFGAGVTANGITHRDWSLMAAGFVVVLYALGVLAVMVISRRPIKLNSTSLSVPGIRSTPGIRWRTVIPIEDVAGVGLRFGYGRNEGGWYLWIWRKDGSAVQTYFHQAPIPVGATADGHKPPGIAMYGFDPAIHEDADRLRQSPTAKTACAIYMDVLELQGPAGTLATLGLQRHAPVKHRRGALVSMAVSAWWSPPDGDMGHPDG